CVYSGHIMPCQMHDGYFDQARQCYAKMASDNPWETRDPIATWWAQTGGHVNGVIMECYMPYEGYVKEVFWAPSAPPAEPTAEEYGAAAWAVLQDVVQAPEIGVWPWSSDPPMGIVAYWTGFWAVDPGPEFTDEGLSLSAPVAGTTLEMTIRLDKIVYDPGDGGNPVICRDAGSQPTVWSRDHAVGRPACSYWYVHRGDYVVTATSSLSAHWSAAGGTVQGWVTVEVARARSIHIGEIQVLNIPNRPR
ncbi:MAG: hypothetical protein LBI84_05055, partial [Propionibacteriaceae bacterium]|nr:hypothetical protein [Propionibacteriaceae bacterium]